MSAEAVAVSATSDAPWLKGRTKGHFSMGEVGAPFLHGGVLVRSVLDDIAERRDHAFIDWGRHQSILDLPLLFSFSKS